MDRPDLNAVDERYSKALDAKPSKGDYTAEGIYALVDSVCDVPELVAWIKHLEDTLSLFHSDDDNEETVTFHYDGNNNLIATWHTDGGVVLDEDRWEGEGGAQA